MKTTNGVVVVGGGVAGLACAALLARGGRTVAVLEAGAEVGGLARSRTRDGFTFNRGAHALYRKGPAEAVLSALEISLDGAPPSLDGVAYRGGATHRLPVSPWAVLTTSLLSWRGRLALMKLFSGLPGLNPRTQADRSAASWLNEQIRDEAARSFVAAMLRLSTYSGDLEAISADAAIQALQAGTQHGVRYLDGGWQSLVDALVDSCRAAGVTVRTRAAVEAVAPGHLALRGGETLEAQHIVLAVPPRVRDAWTPNSAPLHTASVACLDVALRVRPPGPRLAFDLDDPMYLAVHTDTARLGPDGGALIHTLHYLPPAEPQQARAQLEGLLDRTFPQWRDLVVATQFLPSIAVSQGVPQPGRGLEGRPGVRVEGMPGVWQVGDAVGPHGMLADAAMGSARDAADAILAGAAGRRAA